MFKANISLSSSQINVNNQFASNRTNESVYLTQNSSNLNQAPNASISNLDNKKPKQQTSVFVRGSNPESGNKLRRSRNQMKRPSNLNLQNKNSKLIFLLNDDRYNLNNYFFKLC